MKFDTPKIGGPASVTFREPSLPAFDQYLWRQDPIRLDRNVSADLFLIRSLFRICCQGWNGRLRRHFEMPPYMMEGGADGEP